MRPAEPVVRQQAAYHRVAGDEPSRIADRGTNTVNRALGQQLAQQGRKLQRMRLLEGHLRNGDHCNLQQGGVRKLLRRRGQRLKFGFIVRHVRLQ
jgi:hypothetical protein